jgi:carbon starvation protein
VVVTLTGSWQKMFHEDPRIGFLAQARALEQRMADGSVPAAERGDIRHLVFNNRLDAAVTGFFALLILALLAEAAVEWYRILTRRKAASLTESPYVRTRWAEGSP